MGTGEAAQFDGALNGEMKASNPKDVAAASGGRVPLDLFPDTALVAGAMAFHEGDCKYGGYNWRVAGVKTSVYVAALRRHIAAYWNGENIDPMSGLPHLWKALACLAIMIDAEEIGMLNDDRPPKSGVGKMLEGLQPIVQEIAKRYPEGPGRWTQTRVEAL